MEDTVSSARLEEQLQRFCENRMPGESSCAREIRRENDNGHKQHISLRTLSFVVGFPRGVLFSVQRKGVFGKGDDQTKMG